MARATSTELTLRPATLDDADFVADVMTEVRPTSPTDPTILRYWWAHAVPSLETARFVVRRGGRDVGYGETSHAKWGLNPKRYGAAVGDLLPSARSRESLDALFGLLEERIVADGARILRNRANEDDPLRNEVILACGYQEDRRARRWELDLVANRERLLAMTEESRRRMREQGVRLLTLADDSDPNVIEKIWRLSEEAEADVPTTVPHTPEAMETYAEWVKAPGIYADRLWLARVGDEIVGISVLEYPPVRGVVGTDWTATARSVRGRGVARAVKCETVAQAILLGVTRVRTGNDAANAPILHINETMGYRPIPGAISYLRPL